jgi:hypothetical protein
LIVYVLCDDAAQIHETWGREIASRIAFDPPFNLRPQDLGELGVSAMAGAIILALLGWSYRRSDAGCRAMSRQLAMLFAALVFFGVALDVVHSAASPSWAVGYVFATFEEGGELLIASVMLWYVAAVHGSLHEPASVRVTRLVRHFAGDRRASRRLVAHRVGGALGTP